MGEVAVSVLIPTYRRPRRLLETLGHLARCEPAPAEVLIHIDGDDDVTAPALREAPLPVRSVQTGDRLGPGGGRGRLARDATCETLFSLDDDSYPIEHDAMARALQLTERHPATALFALPCLHPGETPAAPRDTLVPACSFEGCGAVLRRTAALAVSGCLPLRLAYGMEEQDLALQLLDAGHDLAQSEWLHVRHEANLDRHMLPAIMNAQIANTGLLPLLRFPWPYVLCLPARVLRRVAYCRREQGCRWRDIDPARIVATLWRWRGQRRPVRRGTMREYMRRRRCYQPASGRVPTP